MMIFGKAIPRRTFLRGVGISLSLPLLEGMIPALASARDSASPPPTRLGFVYAPNGQIMQDWTPVTEGAAFELTPILKPLAPFRDRMLVLSGLNSNEAIGVPGEPGGEHPRASTAYLTGVRVTTRDITKANVETRAGVSIDQIAARELEAQTPLGSLELGIETPGLACDGSCAYTNTICWRDATTPLPMQNQPRAIFERLFGTSDSTDPAERRARIQKNRSILDFVTQEASRLFGDLGQNDRHRVNQYLDAVRDVERRIQVAETQSPRELPAFQRPAGIPSVFSEHAKLMFDLLVLAYQTDTTRVGTLQLGHEMSDQPYPEIGIPDPHHPFTHHQGDPVKIEKARQVNIFHAEMLAYYLDKLASTPDGDGSLLDHAMIVYGSGFGDGNLHIPKNLPVLLVGGASGQIKGGRHIRYPGTDTPLTNLHLTLLDKMGIALDKFGDSNGKLELLTV